METKALEVALKEIDLEVNAETTTYVVMSCEHNVGQNHNITISNKSFEMMTLSKYLGKILTNLYCIHEEIKSRLKSGNACYHSVQNLVYPSSLSKNIKVKIRQSCNFACCFVWV